MKRLMAALLMASLYCSSLYIIQTYITDIGGIIIIALGTLFGAISGFILTAKQRPRYMLSPEKKLQYFTTMTCPYCGGNGQKSRFTACPECDGEGLAFVPRVFQPCPQCKGKGKRGLSSTCLVCEGEGKIPVL